MKPILSLTFLMLLILSACHENYDDGYYTYGQVQFCYNDLGNISSKSSNITEDDARKLPTKVIVGIKDPLGNIRRDSLKLNNFNDYLTSSPISLSVGNYEICEFFVCIGDSIILATPHEDSELAGFVNDPLNINFTISADGITKVTPEVLSTKGYYPEDFGYSTFGYEEVELINFLAAAFTWDQTELNYQLTTAELQILSIEGETLYADTLKSITNIILVEGGHSSYIFKCHKEGFNTYTDTMTLDEIKAFTHDPLEIVLREGNTDLFNALIAYYPFNGNANDESGNNFNGTVYNNNASLTSDRNGLENSAYLFAGNDEHFGNSSSQYINIPNTVDSLTELSLSIWFEFHSYLEYRHHWDGIISFGLHNTNKNTGIIYSAEDKKIYYSVRVSGTKYYMCSVDYNDNWTNTFKHYALTFNGNSGELKCYIDGEEVASKTECYGRVESPGSVAAIGGHYWADVFSARLNGKVDDAKIFNKSLSAEEIYSLYIE